MNSRKGKCQLSRSILLIGITMALGTFAKDHGKQEPFGRVDTSFYFFLDITRNGQKDTTILHISGKSFSDSIFWSVSVKTTGGEIYHYSQIEPPTPVLDSLYLSLNDSTIHCSTFLDCKRKYFYDYLRNAIVRPQSSVRDGEPLTKLLEFSFNQSTRPFLVDSLHLDKDKQDKVMNELFKSLEGNRAFVIWIPLNLVHENFPLV